MVQEFKEPPRDCCKVSEITIEPVEETQINISDSNSLPRIAVIFPELQTTTFPILSEELMRDI